MTSPETPQSPGFTALPSLDESGHIANPEQWLVGIAEEHGLGAAEIALERAHAEGLIAEPTRSEPKHRAEGEPDSTLYKHPPGGRHLDVPEWQIRARQETLDSVPTYAQRTVDLPPNPERGREDTFRGEHRRALRATDTIALEALRAAGVEALRESWALYSAAPGTEALKAAGAAAFHDSWVTYQRETEHKPPTLEDLQKNLGRLY